MMVRWKVEYCMVVLMSVLHLYKSQSQCPDDVESEAKNCLIQYEEHKQLLDDAHKRLYMGTDIEAIRQLCSYFRSAAYCAYQLKRNCPDTEHAVIEGAVADLSSVSDLCQYDKFYEVYARHQSCFLKVSAASEGCYRTYSGQVHHISIQLLESHDQNSRNQLCTHYDTFLICMKTHVRHNCGEEAASLVDVLVRPEIKDSNLCRNETTTTSTMKPTKKPTKGPSGSKNKSVRASYTSSGHLQNFTTSCLLVTFILTWLH